MEKIYDLIIVGGGASGLFAGIKAGQNNLDTLILERSNSVGKKILATGNGRCNFYNTDINSFCYSNYSYFKSLTDYIDADKVVEMFTNIGLNYYCDSECRCYPISNSSYTVLNVLTNALYKNDVKIKLNQQVENIKKQDNIFYVNVEGYFYKAKNVMLATGSNFNLANSIGLKMVNENPSLCGIVVKNSDISGLAGVRLRAKVSAMYSHTTFKEMKKNNTEFTKNIISENGEVIFKDNAINGICVMNLVSFMTRYDEFPIVELDLLPNIDECELKSILEKRKTSKELKDNLLVGLFIPKLERFLLSRARSINEIVNLIKHFPLIMCGKLEDMAQVTCGGVDTIQLDKCAVKNINGLYVGGEMVNQDAICGGYNLTNAWLSGLVTINQILEGK